MAVMDNQRAVCCYGGCMKLAMDPRDVEGFCSPVHRLNHGRGLRLRQCYEPGCDAPLGLFGTHCPAHLDGAAERSEERRAAVRAGMAAGGGT